MRRMMATAMAIVALAGCGPSTAPAPQRVIKVTGEAQKQLASASEQNRAIGLKRAIYDSGSVCKRVTGSHFLSDYKNMAVWQADCADGKGWAVFVAPEGSAQVRPCGDLKELKLPECSAPSVDTAGDKKTAGPNPAA
ncbi:MAG: hypothetical protein ABIQ98_06910 [Sphingomicrobium sp.]